MRIEIDNIPDGLKKARYCVSWKKKKRENGTETEILINPADGVEASVINPVISQTPPKYQISPKGNHKFPLQWLQSISMKTLMALPHRNIRSTISNIKSISMPLVKA